MAVLESGFMPVGITDFAAEGVFARSFGNMRTGTVYVDALSQAFSKQEIKSVFTPRGVEEIKAREMEVKAALNTDSALFATGTYYSGTSGSVPVTHPIWVDGTLYDKTARAYPLASGLIPRVANKGIFATIAKRTALPTAVWRAQGAAQTSATSTYSMAAAPIKCLYSLGEVSGLAQADKTFADHIAMEKEAHFRACIELLENTMCVGDTSAAAYYNAWQGFQNAVTTNTSNQSAAPLALSLMDTALSTIAGKKGECDLIVTDYTTWYSLKALLKPYTIYNDPVSRLNAFGFNAIDYMGIPVVVSLSMPTTASSHEMHFYTVRKEGNVQLRVLQDLMVEDKPSDADSYRFLWKMYVTEVIVYEDWNYRLYGLE